MAVKAWKKVLYEDQDFPDNHSDRPVDKHKNNLCTRYRFWPVVAASGVVTQQLCSVCLFVVLFAHMDAGLVAPHCVLLGAALAALLGYLLNARLDLRAQRPWFEDARTGLVFAAAGYALSPLLMTLTETISSDTLYIMTFFMLLANLLFHHYGAHAAMVSQSMSLSAAIFASVCLASRLPTALHAFATLTAALLVFALWPVLRSNIKAHSGGAHVCLTVSLAALAVGSVCSLSAVVAVLFLLLLTFITFACPALLIRMQPYKNNIYGPWDEAVIQD